ncbi:MAG: efflux RND transporter periplasmic adaptor subunit [Candidatus Eremiobacteraeota bacterium]|nr:efflux RND transporter periplasmic adaptor subunit [Candidatus Eremiobacteraeota bacterium]
MSTATIPAPGPHVAAGAALAKIPRGIWVALALLFAGGILAYFLTRSHSAEQLDTAPVTQGTVTSTVTASGTVNPQNLISVGTQISGTTAAIDVDYNTKVKRDQVLARLDPSTLEAQLAQAQAGLEQARAQAAQASASANGASTGIDVASANAAAQAAAVASAKANVIKTQAALALAQRTESRDAALLAQGYVAQSSVDSDRAAVAQDGSDVAAAQAAVAQAQAAALAGSATVNQSSSTAQSQADATQAAEANIAAMQAIVRQDEINLGHTVITSPVDGTVVAREVSVGQTVAASLQTPTLFSIAQNLGKMEVDINVGEPDIGGVKRGDPVSFSVLAYPNQTFRGTVAQVRINPQTLNNVVTYDVVVYAENAGGKLLPGMTANAAIDVASVRNALTVPLAALHTRNSNAAATPWGSVSGSVASSAITAGSTAHLLVDRGGKPVGVPVYVRLTNGLQAAVEPSTAGTLTTSDRVVIGTNSAHRSGSNGNARSPMSTMGAMRGIH